MSGEMWVFYFLLFQISSFHFCCVLALRYNRTVMLLFVQSSFLPFFNYRLIQPSFYLWFVYVGAPVVCPSFISTNACCFFYFDSEVHFRFCLGLTLNAAFMSSLTFPPSSAFVSSPHLLYRR